MYIIIYVLGGRGARGTAALQARGLERGLCGRGHVARAASSKEQSGARKIEVQRATKMPFSGVSRIGEDLVENW